MSAQISRTYLVGPYHLINIEATEYVEIHAESSCKAAKIALEMFKDHPYQYVRIWRQQSRMCSHIYSKKDGKEYFIGMQLVRFNQ